MVKRVYIRITAITERIARNHTSAYAAQSAFFLVLSMIPFILLLLTMIQYTPVTKADVMTAVQKVMPTSISPTIIAIVNQVYNQSTAVIPLTALTAFWSAGRGVLALSTGLNCVYESKETRNYVILRIRAGFYTLIFILAIVMMLVFLVFGNSLSLFVNEHFPLFRYVTDFVIEIRTVLSLIVLTVISTLIYRFLPNHRVKLRTQLPGAVFTSVGWGIASYIFSMYVDIFQGFSNMYGSLTTIVLIMLWLYCIMYLMLLGGELNVMLQLHEFRIR